MLGVALALAGADAGPLEGGPGGLVFSSEGGAGPVLRWTRAYYRLLSRLRHPAWLGAAVGTLLGALVCWLLIGWLIVPRETATLTRLLVAQQRLEEYRRRDGRYPEPDSQGQLVLDGAACLDAFGTPLRYELRAGWPAQRYRLISSGADTRASADDMCVAGKTLAGSIRDVLVAPLALMERVTGKHSSWSSRLALLRELRCTDSD
jgi:hypothetical protein